MHAPVLPLKLWPLLRDVRLSLSEALDHLFGADEGPKIALAANLGYYGDDPARLWWLFYAIAQGGLLANGGTYIRGGSGALSRSLVGVVEAEGGAVRTGRTVTEIILDREDRAAGVAHTAEGGGDRVVEQCAGFVRQRRPQRARRCATGAGAAGFYSTLRGAVSVNLPVFDRAGAEPAATRAGLHAVLHHADTGVGEFSFRLCALRRTPCR
jgi:phytoene dehydrogenase-like protein